jgi:hypothetical protein
MMPFSADTPFRSFFVPLLLPLFRVDTIRYFRHFRFDSFLRAAFSFHFFAISFAITRYFPFAISFAAEFISLFSFRHMMPRRHFRFHFSTIFVPLFSLSLVRLLPFFAYCHFAIDAISLMLFCLADIFDYCHAFFRCFFIASLFDIFSRYCFRHAVCR